MTKQNEAVKETVLTVDELKRMGAILSDMRETIELYNHALNLVPSGGNIKEGMLSVYYQSLYDLTDTMFEKNQKMMKDLNEISYTLEENDAAFEIEETRKRLN
ncbi:hypothetical protein HZY88_08505 [Aerococcaceae bacterium DSM 111176]|nr:hypothetical protein [Aerococcaceae bacterium DSM 111176]